MRDPYADKAAVKPWSTDVNSAQRFLGAIGAAVRRQLAFPLQMAALLWGVLSEGIRPATWRPPVRSAFRASLTNIVASSLVTIVVTAIIVGIGLAFVPMYELRAIGDWMLTGRIIIMGLFRNIAPLLVGIILLGRSGIPMMAEFDTQLAEDETATLRAEGMDTFQDVVLPRAFAFAVAAFTLGVVFLLCAVLSSHAVHSLEGVARRSFMGALGQVLRVLSPIDLTGVAIKFLIIGLVVALACCVTGLNSRSQERLVSLLARAFRRGVTSILVVTIALSVIL
jgi:phospholipid/cholesterol/gamma-HCH transport system permease protein